MSFSLPRRGLSGGSWGRPTAGHLWIAAVLAICAVFGLVAGASPKYALMGIVGIAFVILVFADLVLGIAIYAAISFLEVLTTSGAGASFDKLAGLLLFASWLIGRATARRESTRDILSRHPAMIAWMIGFLAWSAISVLWAQYPSTTLTTAYRDALEMLVVPIVFSAVRDRRDLVKIIVGYLIGSAISVLYGLVITPPKGAVVQSGRLVGSLGEANQAATVLVAALALAIGLTFVARRSPGVRRVAIVAGVLAPIGLVSTLSRGGLVAAAVVLLASVFVAGRWRGRARRIGAVLVVAMIGYFFVLAPASALHRVTSSNGSGRNDVWLVGWRMFTANPLVGVGAGNFQFVSPQYLQRPGLITSASDFLVAPKVAHNMYLEQLSELGVPGLILMLGFLVAGVAAPLRAAHIFERIGDTELELIARCSMLALVAFLAADFFLSGLLYKQLWIIFALGPALLKLADVERRRRGMPYAVASG